MERTQEFVAALRAAGYRITPQRVEICRALAESREHPTPQALYRQISAKSPGISQATVYNTLTVLRDLGEVVEVGLGQDRTITSHMPRPMQTSSAFAVARSKTWRIRRWASSASAWLRARA